MYKKIIAVDFDGCLVTNRYPGIGCPIPQTIRALKGEQLAGAQTILWTCRRGEQLADALAWCMEWGIRIDAVNENLPFMIGRYGDTRKVGADEYWDDRAVKMPPVGAQ